MKTIIYYTAFLTLTMGFASLLQAQPRGIMDQLAPDWQVKEWFQLPAGKKALDISDFENKVVYLYCFQSWCPGCHRHGFPTLQRIIEAYKDDANVAIIAIQTTFEGFSQNGVSQARQVAKQYDLEIPIGQSGTRDEKSQLMRNYRTGGTPWTIIIDKQKTVRFNDFHIAPEHAIAMIDQLKKVVTKPAADPD